MALGELQAAGNRVSGKQKSAVDRAAAPAVPPCLAKCAHLNLKSLLQVGCKIVNDALKYSYFL